MMQIVGYWHPVLVWNFKVEKPINFAFLRWYKLYGNNIERGTILSVVSFLSVNFLNMLCFCVKNVASAKYEAWTILYVQFYYGLPCIVYDKSERHNFLE
jgi:hypothetical protein